MPPPYTYGVQTQKAGNSPRKERTHFPRTPLPVCVRRIARVHQRDSFAGVKQRSVFGGRGALQRIRTAKNRRRFLSLTSGKHLPNCRVGACLTVRPASQSMIMVNHHLHSMAVIRVRDPRRYRPARKVSYSDPP